MLTSATTISPEHCVNAIEFLAAIGVLISTLELTATRSLFAVHGLLSWQVMQTHFAWTTRLPLARVLSTIFTGRGFTTLLAVRAFAAAALLLPYRMDITSAVATAAVVSTGLLLCLRSPYGLDGSDQMLTVIMAALFCYEIAPERGLLRVVALWFIAAQACMAYFSSGFAKLLSSEWRTGKAISGVLGTANYGNRVVHSFMVGRPHWCCVAAWTVIVFEITFSVVLFMPSHPLRILFLAVGGTFHITTALVMGLNTFFWAFVATYPAVIYTALEFNGPH